MIVKYYKCEFKSDIILNASSNTEGNIGLLDFVPGSNFLGIVAKYYNEFENPLDIFHNANVKFCDANIMIDGKQSYKIPLSYHNLKHNSKIYFNRLFLSEEDEKKLRDNEEQLKQIREGYINDEQIFLTPKYNYSQKSAYDKELRRSEDEKMYGYSALQQGTNWVFKVVYKDEKLIKEVEGKLLGRKRLGKSKTAQYGQVEISNFQTSTIEKFSPKDGYTYIYVNSRLALIDEEGNPTLEPTISNLGLKSGEICWDKTEIKTTSYNPYNFVRQNHDYARNCINKGSVIVVKNLKDNLDEVDTFVGAFLSEGFGEIIINPKFLEPKRPAMKEFKPLENTKKEYSHDELIAFLKYKQNIDEAKLKMVKQVKENYKKFIGPSKSQWGQVRSIATSSKENDEFFDKLKTFVSHGKEKNQWDNKRAKLERAIKELNHKDDNDWREFIKLLAMITAKHTKGGKDGK